jgi:hypothetical protein
MLQSTDLPTSRERFRCAKTDPIFCTTVSGQRAIKHADTFDGIAIS